VQNAQTAACSSDAGRSSVQFARIEDATAAMAAGQLLVVVDGDEEECEGSLVMAAEFATAERIAFFLAHTSGLIGVALTGERLDELKVPLMVTTNGGPQQTAFTVTVDYRFGARRGVSAADRAATIRALISPDTRPADLTRPGHILPLRYDSGGVLRRATHSEAAVDLARAAGVYPAGVLCDVLSPDKTGTANLSELEVFAQSYGLPLVFLPDLVRYRLQSEKLVRRLAETAIATKYGAFRCYAYESVLDGEIHSAFVRENVENADSVLVRVHSECLTGDVFRSLRCDCGAQLDQAMCRVASEGGVVVYLRGHEGRGIGLGHKLEAYRLQELGYDTVDANIELGLPVDSREYGVAAQILVDLGIRRLRLMTNNPAKASGLEGYGLQMVGFEPIRPDPNPENIAYLRAKRDRLGHMLEGLDDQRESETQSALFGPESVPVESRSIG
jgi:3,4-dihydroxy 2-butanone 4-phosphate synthase/GTP cyclohydrolase II